MDINQIIVKLLLKYPFYGTLLSKLSVSPDNSVKTTLVKFFPDNKLLYNKIWFNSLTDNYKLGALKHELLHVVFQHRSRRGNRDSNIWSIASDLSVNSYIDSKFLPESSVTVKALNTSYDFNLLPYKSAEEYYDSLISILAQIVLSEGNGNINFKLENGITLESEVLEDDNLSQFQMKTISKNISDSLEYSGSKKMINTDFLNNIDKIYGFEGSVNWRHVLKKFLSKQGKINIKKSYKRKSRRFDFAPGKIKSKGVKALIALDESGSMPDSMIEQYINELRIINNITGVEIKVTRFDSDCSDPVDLKDYIKVEGRERRGGTNFKPIFILADKMKIDQVIVFTDGDGDYPESCNQRVLWLLSKKKFITPPFGEHVYFNN